ncbi:hypothetical protein G3V96_25635, partial [Escherichia coli]|nr:hypothetical protein [Escherichia coli]
AGDGGMEECVRHRHAGGAVGVFTEAAKSAGPVSERHRARNLPIVFMI